MRPGVLLVNLGSPDSTAVPDVRRYLAEFLSDDRVLDAPKIIQQMVLRLFILPFRPKHSAHAYRQIWTDNGSPLILSTQSQRDALAAAIDIPVAIGMRYGKPSTRTGLQELLAQEVDEIFLVPLYPHYAMSSYETAVAKAKSEIAALSPTTRLVVQPPFYADPDYIDALYALAQPHLDKPFDLVLFSYHGIPERHIRQADPSGCYCLQAPDCCDMKNPTHGMCYRAQCFATTRALTRRAGLNESQWRVAFQSRLGREPWLQPYADQMLARLPNEGFRRILVLCPAFISDCLETLEEINIRGRETFLEAGGEELTYIPCLNDSPAWMNVLQRMVTDWRDGKLSS